MNEEEFDLLDELYFVTPFQELLHNLEWEEELLLKVLDTTISKGWVKVLIGKDNEVHPTHDEFLQKYRSYHYLATKAGLMAHNGR